MRFPTALPLAALLIGSSTLATLAEPVFNRIATFPVAANLPEGTDPKSPTSAEIVTASPDGTLAAVAIEKENNEIAVTPRKTTTSFS